MRLRKILYMLTAAGCFLVIRPIDVKAAQINLALSDGINSTFWDVSDDDMEAALEDAMKKNYTGICVAKVTDYVNVRSEASEESDRVGKLFAKSVGTIEGKEGDWYKITSGNVTGYIKSEYLAIGDEAEQMAEEVGTRVATVTTETLRVREEATTDSSILGLIPMGEELTVTDEKDGFVKVSIEEGDGWVSTDFVELRTDYVFAESKEEEEARLAKEQAAKEAAHRAAEAKAKSSKKGSGKVGSGAGSSTGNSVASFASQFVGNPYVYGGTSLTNGADCSGFVMSVYANFGVGLPHSSSALRGVGYGVSLADAQPGDIICYSGHVGIYVGNNTIVHASTAATGIKYTSPVTYKNVLAVRRIF